MRPSDALPSQDGTSGAPADAGADAGAADAAPCLGGDSRTVHPQSGTCYMFFAAAATWPSAKAACQNMIPAAHMVTIADADEALRVSGPAAGAEPWIGLNDVLVEGTYGWVSGEPVAFTDWGADEPNNTGDCIRLKDGRWADMECYLTRPYICERMR